jgi:hypothetical protein
METILKIASGLLGLMIPLLFAMKLNQGIKNSNLDIWRKRKYRQILIASVSISTVLVWAFSLSGILEYHNGDMIPRFAIPLIVFAFIGLYLLKNKSFQGILFSIPLSSLVSIQIFRFAGTAFLIIAYLKILPQPFQLAGYGDILTGTLAILSSIALLKQSDNSRFLFWSFSIVGLLDLLNVAFLLLWYYPAWTDSLITSERASQFSLVMIPALVAPIALLLHAYAIFNALESKQVSWPETAAL